MGRFLSSHPAFQVFPGIGQEGPVASAAVRLLNCSDSGAENPEGVL